MPGRKRQAKLSHIQTERVRKRVARKKTVSAEARSKNRKYRIAMVGAECFPFVKTGGLGDVMYALPRALIRQGCELRVILPRYACIPDCYQENMTLRGELDMELCADGRSFPFRIMETELDGVIYDFIDNESFFGWGSPYTDLVRDIPKYCFFAKAALAALNYLDWTPDVIHCHDWQAALVPVFLHAMFEGTKLSGAKTMLTIHNLRFQGVYNIPTIAYWSGLPWRLFHYTILTQGAGDANMFKAGIACADCVTTVSTTYACEIQSEFYGEGLDAHLRYHAGKLHGIVNGIDVELWNSRTDTLLEARYDAESVLKKKRINKLALQERLGLERNPRKMVIGLISRLTDQKGLNLVNEVLPELLRGDIQFVVLGTGEAEYEALFQKLAEAHPGSMSANLLYDEALAHLIYAGADALLVPSLFEPCGLTQLIAMHYGTIPIVRETGGLKDTVQPYNEITNEGNGFSFDRFEAQLLLGAIQRARSLFYTDRGRWDEMVRRDMAKDVSWDRAAAQYRSLYVQLIS